MSSNKRMCLKSPTEMRQSFDERICDDLCEDILKYLPIEDRFRLRAVSKQFQRTIEATQQVLPLIFNCHSDTENKLLAYCQILFKKCSKINRVTINGLPTWLAGFRYVESNIVKYYYDLVKIIIENCNNLTYFDFYTDFMSEENRNNFIEKFGSKLISVNFKNCIKPEVFLSSMKVNNIEKLVINHMTCGLSQLCFSKLKSLTIRQLTDEMTDFNKFIEGKSQFN